MNQTTYSRQGMLQRGYNAAFTDLRRTAHELVVFLDNITEYNKPHAITGWDEKNIDDQVKRITSAHRAMKRISNDE